MGSMRHRIQNNELISLSMFVLAKIKCNVVLYSNYYDFVLIGVAYEYVDMKT